jgi:hypothetical protein
MQSPSPIRPRSVFLNLVLLTALGLGAASAFTPQASRDVFDPSTDIDAVCSVNKPYSAEASLGEPKHRFPVTVPVDNPLPAQNDARVYALAKDDVVQLDVSSPRPGGVAMHGILETHRLRVGGVVSVEVRVKYTGRFPLHFHGDDGSHIEVAVFEVR